MLQSDTKSQPSLSGEKDIWNERASALIIEKCHILAERIVEMIFAHNSELAQNYTPRQRLAYFSDTERDLQIIAAAILLETPNIFRDHMAWTSEYMNARNISGSGLKQYIRSIKDVLQEALSPELRDNIAEYLDAGLEGISGGAG